MAGIQLLALVWGILRFFREPCAKPRIIPWCSFGTFWLSSPNPLSSCSHPSHLPAVLRTVPPRLPSPAPIQVTENLTIHAPVKGRRTGAAASPHSSQPLASGCSSGGQAPSSVPPSSRSFHSSAGWDGYISDTILPAGNSCICEWFWGPSPHRPPPKEGWRHHSAPDCSEFPSRNPPWWVRVLLLGGLCEGWPPVYFLAAEWWAPVF